VRHTFTKKKENLILSTNKTNKTNFSSTTEGTEITERNCESQKVLDMIISGKPQNHKKLVILSGTK